MKRLFAPLVGLGMVLGNQAVLPADLNAQQDQGVQLDSDAVEIGIGGRVQTQFNTTTADDEPFSELFIRRARLELDVRVNEVISGRIQPEFAGNRVDLKDVYLKLALSPGFQVLTGKAYKPFSLLEQTSSTRMLPIERGARIRGVDAWDEYELVNELGYSDRDIGVQVMGEPAGAPLGLSYQAGVFRGPLHGAVEDEDSYQFAARATISPLTDVTIGAGWSSRDFDRRVVDRGGQEVVDLERGNAFEVDLEYGAFDPGLHVLGEVAFGDAEPFLGGEFFGAQAWLGYRTGELGILSAVEPIFRASYGDLDGDADTGAGGTLLTPGLNLYFGGRNRVMFNYDFWSPSSGDTEGSFKAMFQLAF